VKSWTKISLARIPMGRLGRPEEVAEMTGIASALVLNIGTLTLEMIEAMKLAAARAIADKVPADYLRRQTVKSAERFITPELKSFEDKVLGARDRSLAREKALYEALLDHLTLHLAALQSTTAAIAQIDVLQCFAERATVLDCAQPTLVEEPMAEPRNVLITGGNRGIGLSIARAFVQAWDNVVITYRSGQAPEGLQGVICEVTDSGTPNLTSYRRIIFDPAGSVSKP